MLVGSLFSGIGGLDLGLERAGMTVSWQCEFDASCRELLNQRWPDVPVYDDVRTVTGGDVERVDVLCGGFPCQDLSVAGGRAGLAGERSGLFHQFMRLADEIAPRWVVIENVPGLLSSNDGRDMGVVLGVLADLGYGWCYRVLDAQYFGVAQRRRRVFIVGCLGDPARAAAVLLEPESCDGDSPPRRETGSGVAPTLEAGANRTGGTRPPGTTVDTAECLIPTLARGQAASERWDGDTETFVPITVSNDSSPVVDFDRIGSLKIGTGLGIPSGPAVTVPSWTGGAQHDQFVALDDVAPTLAHSSNHHGGHHQPMVAFPLAMRGRDDGAELEMGEEGVYNALRAGDGGSSRANWVAFSENQRAEVLETHYARQLTTGGGKPGQGYPAVRQGMAVRRLTPLECERLQGFPDGWTEGFADSTRYRMLGNAVAVPCADWIGRRMVAAA